MHALLLGISLSRRQRQTQCDTGSVRVHGASAQAMRWVMHKLGLVSLLLDLVLCLLVWIIVA